MSAVKVFVTDSLPPEARRVLAGFEVNENSAEDSFLEGCEALVCWPSRAKAELLGKMKGLRMIQTMSAGVDALDFRAVPPEAEVFSNAGAFTYTVAEHAWGLLLGVAKGIHLRNQRTIPRALRGKTLLVVGAGAIGSEVARLAKSLPMKTIGLSRSLKAPEHFDETGPLTGLPEFIARADAVVIALPLTKLTSGLVTYDLLSRAKDGVIVVNVGRGELVDEDGLIRWLSEKPESRYATDVFWIDEGKESFKTKAWDLSNFAGTLHVAGGPLGEDLMSVKLAAVENVRKFFEGGAAANRIERSEYYQEPFHTPISLNTRGGGGAEQGQTNAKKEIRHKRIRGSQGR